MLQKERILLDDGKLILKIVSTNKINEVEAEVIQGGAFKSNKVNCQIQNFFTSFN